MGKKKVDTSSAPEAPVKRWNAFTCPDCRGIFRVPRDYQGLGVACPICDRMLRIPRKGDPPEVKDEPKTVTTGGTKISGISRKGEWPKSAGVQRSVGAPKMVSPPQRPLKPAAVTAQPSDANLSAGDQLSVSQNTATAGDEESGGVKRKRSVRRRKKTISVYARYQFFFISFGVLSAIFVIALLWKTLQPKDQKEATNHIPSVMEISPALPPIKKEDAQKINLLKIESIVKAFMEAETVEEMKQHVFLDAAVEQKIDAYYKESPWQKPGFSSLSEEHSQISSDGMVYQSKAADASFEMRDVFLRLKRDNYQVDWESWVAWGEMGCGELRKLKPKQAVEVRVIVSSETYFNFDFPKEQEKNWQSYKLTFPNEERILHGYVTRAGKLDDAMRMNVDEPQRYMILRIYYREDGTRDDQVLVESVVQEGWVR
jgi:hypothetical protein